MFSCNKCQEFRKVKSGLNLVKIFAKSSLEQEEIKDDGWKEED